VDTADIGIKNLSPTQIQAIGYAIIPSHLHLALGLCISWVIEKHFVKTRLLVITMVKYIFCCGNSRYWNEKAYHKHKSKPLAMQTFPVTFT